MDLDEERLMVEKAKTDSEAFGKLYDFYYGKILNYLVHRLMNVATAQDLTSEVFFKAMTKLHTFKWRDISFSSWLYKIANNEIKMYYRRKEHRTLSLNFLTEEHHIELSDSVDIEKELIAAEEALSKNEQFKTIQKIVVELPIVYQEVLVLRFLEGKSLIEISEVTKKNLNTIKSIILRGKEKVKKEFIKQNGGDKE